LPAFFLPAMVLRGPLLERVGAGALAVDRQATAVPQALVAADLDLATDVGGDLAAEVTLHPEVLVDVVAQLQQVLVTEVLHA
jgi:hypothetical protein